MVDLLALSFLPLWRWRFVGERLRAGDAPGDILEQQCSLPLERGSAPCARSLRARAHATWVASVANGLQPILWGHSTYPAALAAIPDPPAVLWVRGDVAALTRAAVAIVGSRAGSEYALAVAARLAEDLAAHGFVVVSGLARGVDSAAHRGALSRQGCTFAVLGCGVDRIYPRENARLADDIVRSGALISEMAPGTPPHPRFFPRRNRLISGLSRAVIVVEAGAKSGSLITARCALEQGRDVMAVPGNVLTERNRGGHALLRDGARLVESIADVLDELGVSRSTAASIAQDGCPTDLDDEVLAAISRGESSDLDQIAARSAWPVQRLLPRLLELEIDGRLKRVAGGRFVRL